ncbi:MAG TPA: hypothetical protein VHS52_01455 [Acidimicrobiales bacterium]|nr:hypothetical protein [Acidimicrobiales bacterium]
MATRSARRDRTRRRICTLIGAGAVTAVVGGAMAGTAYAASVTVACTGPGGGAAGLRAAIAHSNHTAGADTIDLAPGCTYVLTKEANPGNGLPVVTGTLVIHGHGATIRRSSESAFRIVEVAPGADLTLDQITVSGGLVSSSGGATAFGGGILNSGQLTIIDSTISDNGVSGTGASAGGGGIANNGTLSVHDTVLRNNTATATGTGIIFAAVGGAILNRTGATTTIDDSSVVANAAISTGSSQLFFIASAGGIANSGTLTVNRTDINGNRAVADGANGQAGGGGISIADGVVTMADSTVAGNAATASGAGAEAHGGGVENNGQTKLTDTEVTGNVATGPVAQGGGLYNGRRLTLIRSRVVANVAAGTSAPGQGGGIFTDAGHVTLRATVVSANQPDDCQPAIAGC